MGKKLVLALALVALMAVPAFASVQNVKVGGDLKTTSVIRSNFDLDAGTGAGIDDSQNVFLSQVGLNVQADLTDNVSTMLRLTNERLWGGYSATAEDSNVNLDTAYVTMKEMLYSPLTVVIGRQPLQYGNQFLVGDGDSTTTVADVTDLTGGVNFDAIKAILGYDTFSVDLFMAKVDEGTVTALNDTDDADFYGVNASFKLGDKNASVIDAYTFVKLDKSGQIAATDDDQKLYVPGLRVSTNLLDGLALSLEAAYQTGSTASDDKIKAYGFQGMASFSVPVMEDLKPVLSLGYTYLSGDDDTTDDNVKAFDPLYNNQNVGRIWSTLFDKSNLAYSEVGFELIPVQDFTMKLSWTNLNQVKKADAAAADAINQPFGVGTQAVAVTDKKALGNEFDLDVTYAYTEDVKFGLSAGYFAPGKAFSALNKEDATQLITSVAVAF